MMTMMMITMVKIMVKNEHDDDDEMSEITSSFAFHTHSTLSRAQILLTLRILEYELRVLHTHLECPGILLDSQSIWCPSASYDPMTQDFGVWTILFQSFRSHVGKPQGWMNG